MVFILVSARQRLGTLCAMRAVVQVASQAQVTVGEEVIGQLHQPGLVVLLGINTTDTEQDATAVATKLFGLRILEGETSAESTGAPLLVVSQFTLYGDVRKGRRPSWSAAARPEVSKPLYEYFVSTLRDLGADVQTGEFGAKMEVSLTNSGPFTIVIDSDDLKRPRRG